MTLHTMVVSLNQGNFKAIVPDVAASLNSRINRLAGKCIKWFPHQTTGRMKSRQKNAAAVVMKYITMYCSTAKLHWNSK